MAYARTMAAIDTPGKARGAASIYGWRRLRFVVLAALVYSVLFGGHWQSGYSSLFGRVLFMGLVALTAFGLFEQWPRRLPRWVGRWALQVIAVAIAMPLTVVFVYVASTAAGAPPFWKDKDRLEGFGLLMFSGILFVPWIALGALVRQKEAVARHQALAFELERSELERRALDARLHRMQAQVAPHFLFNTLANVQALVEAGSPRASALLQSLIAYLRAAVPRLEATATTLAQELELVRAYLKLMHMRMPDRLQFALYLDPDALALQCPPMTLLTLVENAVKHGIDPSEEGGRIDVRVQRHGERCTVRVIDTGIGLQETTSGLGTGLSTLRERLELAFGDAAQLRLYGCAPRGVCAELDLPAREAAP